MLEQATHNGAIMELSHNLLSKEALTSDSGSAELER